MFGLLVADAAAAAVRALMPANAPDKPLVKLCGSPAWKY
jgi:hypothetical protein